MLNRQAPNEEAGGDSRQKDRSLGSASPDAPNHADVKLPTGEAGTPHDRNRNVKGGMHECCAVLLMYDEAAAGVVRVAADVAVVQRHTGRDAGQERNRIASGEP